MKILISCGTKFHSDQVAYQLQNRGILYRVVTSHPSFAYKRVDLDRDKIFFLPPIYLLPFILQKLGKWFFFRGLLEWILAVVFDRMASHCLGEADVSISWAWTSLSTIRAIKKKGGLAIVEKCGSCNKHQNEILEQEYKSLNLQFELKTPGRIVERELVEFKEADYILCPSRYVAESIQKYGVPKYKTIIIPYGASLSLFHKIPKKDKVFRVLYVGSISVRKGLIYLFQALENLQLENFECVIIGKVEEAFQPVFDSYKKYFKHIDRVEHSKLKEYYSNASVFVFPSLDEGMALVQLEAMACGLPVIYTPNSGGDEVIRDGHEGLAVPIRNAQAIREKIEYLYQHPDELSQMSDNAQSRVKDYTWEKYGERLERVLRNLIVERAEK